MPRHNNDTITISRRELTDAVRKIMRFSKRDFEVKAMGVDAIGVAILPKSSGNSDCAFTGSVQATSDSAGKFVFSVIGKINEQIPTNMIASGGGLCVLDIAIGTDQYIQLHCETDGTLITDCTLQVSDDPAGSPGAEVGAAPATFNVDLYIIDSNGTAYRAIQCANLTANPVLAMQSDNPEPICAGNPHVDFYTWLVQGQALP